MIRVEKKLNFKAYVKLLFILSFRSFFTWMVLASLLVMLLLIGMRLWRGYTIVQAFLELHTWIPVAFSFYYFFLIYWGARKNYNSNAAVREHVTFEIDDKMVKAFSKSSNSEIDWEVVHKVLEFKNWVLIYISNTNAFMIPTAELGSQLPEFRTLVRNAGVKAKLRK